MIFAIEFADKMEF